VTPTGAEELRAALDALDRAPGGPRQRVLLPIAGRVIAVGHLDRVLFPPGPGHRPARTKRDLIRYYLRVSSHLLPHLAGRALTVTRWPHGIEGPSFFQKHLPAQGPAVPEGRGQGPSPIVVREAADLAALAALAAIEVHAPLAPRDQPDRPDLMVVDLDPMPPAGWPQVQRAGRAVRTLLDGLGLLGIPKTSGATGLHVYVPIRPGADCRRVTLWARAVGMLLRAADPTAFTLVRRVAARRGIYVDAGQNARGHTMAAPYSVRARPGAPVSTPLAWDEVAEVTPQELDMDVVPARLARQGDLMAPLLGCGQDPAPLEGLARDLRLLPKDDGGR
jgi:bifunctional non-homologous end joining protein LigD